MPNWTNWVQPVSGLAAIIGTLVAVVMAVLQASNTLRMKATLDIARPFVRALALSLDKPEILAAYESELTTAKDILRRKRRRTLVVAGSIFALSAIGAGAAKLIPLSTPGGIRFSVGDAAQQECSDTGLGWVSNTTCTNHWFLDSSGQRIQAQATPQGAVRETDLEIFVDGCSGRAQVRWELLADGESLGNGTAGSERPAHVLNVPADKSSFTIRAERLDDDSCSAELVVKAVMWH